MGRQVAAGANGLIGFGSFWVPFLGPTVEPIVFVWWVLSAAAFATGVVLVRRTTRFGWLTVATTTVWIVVASFSAFYVAMAGFGSRGPNGVREVGWAAAAIIALEVVALLGCWASPLTASERSVRRPTRRVSEPE